MRETPTTSDILDLVRRFVLAERERFPIDEAYLFGSWAYGNPREDSDIDVGLVVDGGLGPDDEATIFSDAQKMDRKLEPVVFAKDYFTLARLAIIQDMKKKGIRIA